MLRLGRRLLPILQLTRMALVFTALADSGCAFLMLAKRQLPPDSTDVLHFIDPRRAIALSMISIGLYGFGMSLNDIIDRRRDTQLARHRPLPSGRIGVVAAHVICCLLAAMALCGALLFTAGQPPAGQRLTLLFFAFTLMLIVFYDLAGKYLVAPGLLTLGLIRFFHAALPAPHLTVPWQPLLLLNHVTLLSAFSYKWEQKRPPLTRRHWWAVFSGLASMDLALILSFVWRRRGAALAITPALALPAAAVAVFLVLAILVRKFTRNARQAGQTLRLLGLLWLIVYDAAFVAAFVGPLPALLLFLLLPIAYLSVQLMRWWSQLVAISQRPAFKRVET